MRRERQHSDLSGKVDWGASVSLEAERQFLGLLLLRADVFDQVGDDVRPAHFYEPLHRRIFDLVMAHRSKGQAITRDRLRQLLLVESTFREQGGDRFLDAIEGAAALAEMEGTDPADLGRLVADLHMRREVIAACADIARGARADGITSGRDLRDMLERRMMAADFTSARETLHSIEQLATAALANAATGGRDLLSTGLRKLDDRLGKCERGDFILIGGRPSMGKTALASCWAMRASGLDIGVVELNGEMSEGQIARRHLADFCFDQWDVRGPTYRDIRSGRLTDGQKQMLETATRELAGRPLFAMRKRGMTLAQVRTIARRQALAWQQQGKRLGFLFIDSINNMDAALTGYSSPVQAMSVISSGLKSIAVDLDCVVVGLSQLSRDIERREDKRPVLSDLRDSGSLEQDADVVLAVYRDAYYAEREAQPKKGDDRMEWESRKESPTVECIALKVKEGAPGTDKLWGDVARNAIRDELPAFTNRAAPGQLDLNQPIDEVPL